MSRLRFPSWLGFAALLVTLVAGGVLLTRVAYAGPLPFGWGHWMGWAGKAGAAGAEQAVFADLREGRPVTLELTPGTVTAASASGLTVQVKDGPTRSFGVDSQTHMGGTPAVGDQVVVIAKDGSSIATAVLGAGAERGPRGGWHRGQGWHGGWVDKRGGA